MKKLSVFILIVILVFTIAGCNTEIMPVNSLDENAQPEIDIIGTLVLNGSTSMTKLCNALGESFMDKYPNVTVEKSNTGSGAAVQAVLNGTASIGDLSRKLKDDEKPEKFNSVVIALDGIAVVVNKENNISNLTKEQLINIFTGEAKSWKDLNGIDAPITVIGREESSGTREGFESILKIGGKCKYSAEYPEAGDVVSKVSNDKSAIGYVSLFSVSGGIKATKIDDIEPTKDNVSNGRYVIQRPFVQIFMKNTDNQLIKRWFEFLKTDEAKSITEEQGLVSVDINL